MTIKPILTMCAAVTVGAAAFPLFAQAQQAYPPGSGYSQPYQQPYSQPYQQPYSQPYQQQPYQRQPYPQPYSPGSAPNFESADNDAGGYAAPSPDPRYGRPYYSDRSVPSGPVMSPDDPRYGRPSGPPAVIYSDRPGAPQAYGDPNAPRPPEDVGATGTIQPPPVGPDGRPMTVAALPPDEQPETGPAQLPPNLRRQEVSFVTKEPPGTIIVDTSNTYLYYVLGNGRAIRYGVRVGRDGFTWSGVQKITRKKEWPDWLPPSEMIDRQPYLPRFMAGGPGNPLGARAMYLGNTAYRIHGTNQPSTIGKFVSSGCIGMLNEDVTDLFGRVKVGTRVVVWPGGPPPGTATASAQPVPGPSAMPASRQPVQIGPPNGGTTPTVVPPLPAPVTVR